MEYKDMPNSWLEYYPKAFEYVNSELGLGLTGEQLKKSLDIFRSYSPSVNYREEDYSPEKIFSDVTHGWGAGFKLEDVINKFFESMKLRAYIYPDTVPALSSFKKSGYKLATLTDVATGMPDELHKSYFSELLPYFDLYVSSSSCGYRKPNTAGLVQISKRFELEPCNMLMIGDEKKDVTVAKRFGCCSVLIDRGKSGVSYGQDYTVYNLDGLVGLLNDSRQK